MLMSRSMSAAACGAREQRQQALLQPALTDHSVLSSVELCQDAMRRREGVRTSASSSALESEPGGPASSSPESPWSPSNAPSESSLEAAAEKEWRGSKPSASRARSLSAREMQRAEMGF